jgi:hypothetical protein
MTHLAEYSDLNAFDMFTHQIYGYFITFTNTIDPVTYKYIQTGPYTLMVNYFSENPLSIFFGKGMTYLMEARHYDIVQINNYGVFLNEFSRKSSDFYILNLLEQFGVFGMMLIISIFIIIPIMKMNADNMHHVLVLNTFLIATLHYAPTKFFILMMFVGYSVYSLYFKRGEAK